MYDGMYEIWKRELQNIELEELPTNFYSEVADFIAKFKEETRMLDKKAAKARLLKHELRNVKRMLRDLMYARYKKILKKASEGEKFSSGILASEEEKLLAGILPFAEAFQSFTRNLLQGRLIQINVEQDRKTVLLRFLKEVPAIVGADMKPYGPFVPEDVASLPSENAKILIKQSLAQRIETTL
jgi:DNA replication initiation complex subunit (GINS family)